MPMQRKSILFVSLSLHTSDYHVTLLNDILRNDVDGYHYAINDTSA